MNFFKSKAVKIIFGLLFGSLLLLYFLPIVFQEKIEEKFRKTLENQLVSDASFTEIRLTFFKHFPSLTLSADDLYVEGSSPFEGDTLFYAEDFSVGISLISLAREYPNINELFLNNATINIRRDVVGNSNFDVMKSKPEEVEQDSLPKDEFGIEITKIVFEDTDFTYEDTSLDILILAHEIEYAGNGVFVDKNVELNSQVQIGLFELDYAGVPWLQRDRVQAELLTEINTESTTLNFRRNDLVLNELPVDFKGVLVFLPGGYDMNFILESFGSSLEQIASILPEEYFPAINEMSFGGEGDIVFSLQGEYMPEQNLMPSMALNFQLRDGMISHSAAEKAIENIRTSTNILIPGFDAEKLQLDIDSLGFEIGDGYLRSRLSIEGQNPMKIDTEAKMQMDVGALDKALGNQKLNYSGILETYFKANGIYSYEEYPKDPKTSKIDRVTIPAFNLESNFRNGYLKWARLPEAMEDISFDLLMSTDQDKISDIKFAVENFNLKLLDKISSGRLSFDGNNENRIEAAFESHFDLEDIEKFYPLDSGYQLRGELNMEMVADGNFFPKKKVVPVTNTTLTLENGFIKTPHYPDPIEDIQLELDIMSNEASLRDLSLDLKPVSFTFVDHPFTFKADLDDFEDLKYKVTSAGTLDLGKLYSVFGVENIDVNGYLITDVTLEGSQSAAASGRYRELNNEGSIIAEDIRIDTEYLPEPIIIKKGQLDFTQERIVLTDVQTNLAGNEVQLDGYISNYLEYMVASDDLIQGELEFQSNYVDLDKWMFFSEDETAVVDSMGQVSGVILPPAKLDISFRAKVDSINFSGLKIYNLDGEIKTLPREFQLNDTSFELVGGDVTMDGSYRATDPYRADFDYHIIANQFDIKRAYDEVTIFREMASFAEYSEGIASVDYELSGVLDANMYPIMPSLEGEGVLGMDNVRLKGFKLMNSIAKETDNEELRDPELSDVFVKSSIDNNIMTIPRTKMKIFGFRPRFEGQVGLDGEMRIDLRLGLPPFGLLGIPMKITGNMEEYDMRIGKVTKKEELQEITDEEWEKEIKSGETTENTENDN